MKQGINTKHVHLGGTWASSAHGQSFFAEERTRLEAGLRQAIGPSTLQIGSLLQESIVADLELPYLLKVQMGPQPSAHSVRPAEIAADPAFLPFAPDSFSTVILPHVLEAHSLPHQVLREAHRVLQAEGYVVITGFNPTSLLGLQRWLRPKAAFPGRYYTAGRVIDWLQLLGFEVATSAKFHYAPLSSRPRIKQIFGFMESVGNRWLPMTGGGYMIAAKKKEFSGTPVGRLKYRAKKPKLATPAAVRRVSKSKK